MKRDVSPAIPPSDLEEHMQDTDATSVETPEPVQGDPDDLADAGKKALAAERRARAAAEKEAKALKARLDEIEAAQLSREEAAEKRAADAEKAVAAERTEKLRWKYAKNIPGVTDEEVELYITGVDEDTIARQVDGLVALKSATTPAKGVHVPNVGVQPAQPPSLHEQIAAAETNGDWKTALGLKAQVVADLARNIK